MYQFNYYKLCYSQHNTQNTTKIAINLAQLKNTTKQTKMTERNFNHEKLTITINSISN